MATEEEKAAPIMEEEFKAGVEAATLPLVHFDEIETKKILRRCDLHLYLYSLFCI